MSRTALLGRRTAVGALAAVTLGAGLPAMLATPAAAAAPERVVATPPSSASAGTCTPVTVTPVDSGGLSADAATVTVTIDEGDSPSASQDVDFCRLTGDSVPRGSATSPAGTASFTADGDLGMDASQDYTPGDTLTPTAAAPDNGDNAASGGNALQGDPQGNPTGVDRAVYRTTSGGRVTFGVVGLTTGRTDVTATTDNGSTGGTTVTFTDGGAPGTVEAANAVRKVEPAPATDSAQQGTPQRFTVLATNGQGNTVRGVTPLVQVRPGGANSAPADVVRADCGATDNAGVAVCFFQGAQVGTDTLLVYVDQTTNGGATGPQTAEPQATITRTTTLRAVSADQARFVDLTPESATTTVGASRDFTARVTAQTGAPAQGVTVTIVESGPGRFSTGAATTATRTVVTDVEGRAVVTVLTDGEVPGRQTLTATISGTATQCGQTTAPAGRCSDTATHDLVVAGTPSPSTSPSAGPTASSTPSPSATTPSPTVAPVQRPTVAVNPSTIIAVQQRSVVSGTAVPGSTIEIHAYSRPSTTYQRVRTGTVGADGRYAFEVGPSGNTRLFARTVTPRGTADSDSIVLTVRTSLNLKVARTGTRTYRFTGSLLPKRPGQLITVFYEKADGDRVIAARARNAADGTYNVTRTFSGTGTFTLYTGTGTDNNNAGNNSNRVRVAIR